MIRLISTLALAALLAGCGADGPPVPPKPKPAKQDGVTISGEVRVGVTARL